MDLKNLKIDLPKRWREASRMGGGNQVIIHIYHINPLAHIEPKRFQDQSMPSGDPKVNIYRVGIPGPGMNPLSDFYKGMKGAIAAGFMPPEWTMQKLDKLWKDMTESPHAERPGESDLASDIEIIQCQDAETAKQTLKNKALMPIQGFDVPIPGGVTGPGLPKNMTMGEYLKSNILKSMVPKEQFEQLQSVLKEVQQKIPEVKQSFQKAGIKYREGKYLGCEAIYYEYTNPNPPPKPKLSSRATSAGEGGGARTDIPPLPKITKLYPATNIMYLGILFKNFIINGPLLWVIDSLPSGDTPCYSLTQTKEVITTTREGGVTFKDIAIVPLVSNYAKEGYFYKEEVEEIFKGIIRVLK